MSDIDQIVVDLKLIIADLQLALYRANRELYTIKSQEDEKVKQDAVSRRKSDKA